MSLHRIWQKLIGTTAPVDKTDEAILKADEVIENACIAVDKLSVYENQEDPFTAFLVDIYQNKQMGDIFRR